MENEAFNSSADSSNRPTHAQIAALAHELWIEQGCPEGRDKENWYEAERELTRDLDPSWTAASSTATAGATMPRKEDVGDDRKTILQDDDANAEPFAKEAPLAAKVERQIESKTGRPESRNSPTSLEL